MMQSTHAPSTSDTLPAFIAESVPNLRDIGGLFNVNGLRLKTGRLLRSSNFEKLISEDRARLAELRVRTVIDLRGMQESMRAPSREAFPDARIVNLCIEPRSRTALHDSKKIGDVYPESVIVEVMKQTYANFVHQHAPVFSEVLHMLLEPENYPVIFHCTAGKDRTGYAAALILLALDVPEDAVKADYLATNGRWHAVGRSADLAMLSDARYEYIAHALNEVNQHWGSVHAYLELALNFCTNKRQRLAQLLLSSV